MKAIALIMTLTFGLLVGPLAAEAPPPRHVFRVGLLYASSPSPGTAEAFRQGLRDLGYVEGQNLVIEERRAERSEERLRALAAELVQLPVEVLVAQGGLYTLRAAKDATSTIPIVMVGASDPVGQGFVASLAQPGGNITGTSTIQADLDGKRLALLQEVVPHAARIAVLVNPGLAEIQQRRVDTLVGASRALGVALQVVEVRRADELKGAFRDAGSGRGGAPRHDGPPALRSARRRHHSTGAGVSGARHLPLALVSREWGPHVVCPESAGPVTARCLLCGSHPEGSQARRPAGGAADHVRAGHQSQDRPGLGSHHSPVPALPGDRRDPLSLSGRTLRHDGGCLTPLIEDSAVMINAGFNDVTNDIGEVKQRLDRIENLLLAEQKREIEDLKTRMKRLEDALAV
jgi:hypothetical protein